jgi:hypothetical protein
MRNIPLLFIIFFLAITGCQKQAVPIEPTAVNPTNSKPVSETTNLKQSTKPNLITQKFVKEYFADPTGTGPIVEVGEDIEGDTNFFGVNLSSHGKGTGAYFKVDKRTGDVYTSSSDKTPAYNLIIESRKIKDKPNDSAKPSATPDQNDIKAMREFLFGAETSNVHVKLQDGFTSVYTESSEAEGIGYHVLMNGNITEEISGGFEGNYKNNIKFNFLGFLSQMMESDKITRIEKVDVERDTTFNDITVDKSKFHLDLLNNLITLNGESMGQINDICNNHLCYDYSSELRHLLGAKGKTFESSDNTLEIIQGNNSENIPAHIDFTATYHKESKSGPHFASISSRVTKVEGNKVYFKILDGFPYSNQVETSFKQDHSVGEGFLEYTPDKAAVKVTWDVGPNVASDQTGYRADFSEIYTEVNKKK